MSNRLAVFLICLSAGVVHAQDTTRMSAGVEASYGRPGRFAWGHNLSVVFRIRSHTFSGGAAIVYEAQQEPGPRKGIQAGYYYRVPGRNRRFAPCIGVQSSFVAYTRMTKFPNNSREMAYAAISETAKIKALDSFPFFGFTWNFHRYVYLRMIYGIGLSVYGAEHSYQLSNGETVGASGPMALRPLSFDNRLLQFSLGFDLVKFMKVRQ